MAEHLPETQPAAGVSIPTVGAAVLCGGASRRLGADKASELLGGVPLAVVMGRVALAAGAMTVVGVGARSVAASALETEGMEVLADRWPGQGPVGGVVSALGSAGSGLLIVVGCDHPWLRPGTLAALVGRLAADPGCAAVVAEADGRLHPTIGVWRVAACAAPAAAYFADGGRSLQGLAAHVGADRVAVSAGEVRDVDTPDDLAAARAGSASGTLRDAAVVPDGESTTSSRTR